MKSNKYIILEFGKFVNVGIVKVEEKNGLLKKSTKIGVTFTILTVIVLVVGIIFAVLIKKELNKREDMTIVRSYYGQITGNNIDVFHYQALLLEKYETYDEATYEEEHESYVEILTKFNEEIVSLNENVAVLEDKCSRKYDDPETNIFCSYYPQAYELSNNIYVTQVTRYNDMIKAYNENEENEKDFDLIELINKEIIDYDKNGITETPKTE